MREFSNLNELAKYVSSNGAGLAMSDDENKKIMIEQASILEGLLKENIRKYYSESTPVYYDRTENWIKSIEVGEPYKTGSKWNIDIIFNDMVMHKSVMSDEKVNVAWLYEVGFKTKLDYYKRRYKFTYFEGTHYIRKAIDQFNRSNIYGIQITVYKPDGTKYI